MTQLDVVAGSSLTMTYDSIGNILSKSDIGSYSYNASGAGALRPHAVTAVAGIGASYTYDANGNLTSSALTNGPSRVVTWTASNMPASIAQGGEQLVFGYDSEQQRVKQEKPDGTTLYFHDRAGSGIWIEKTTSVLGVVTWTNYIFAGSEGMVAARFETVGGSTYTRYFHKDHLGSIQVLTDEAGNVAETLAYDGWGKRRYPNGTPDDGNLPSSATTRGFTGHEQLEVGLVHMNGRIYDPQIGRFVSADPTVENPYSTQGWNRYAYVGNNPLAFTDPNGFCFLGCFWKPILKVAKPIIIVAAVVLAQQYELLPTITAGLTIGGTQVL